jgi:O6-methylguanine-DNA--protein-cysteine methyltransferase
MVSASKRKAKTTTKLSGEELKEKLEEQIGECLGLERAAQKAVQELESKGLLDKEEIMRKMEEMKEEASNHEQKLEQVIQKMAESQELKSENIEQHAEETLQKATQMMHTYLGEEPDTQDALEFLCLAEGGEVTHYEVLSSLVDSVKQNRAFGAAVRSILKEEQRHLALCTKLARQNVIKPQEE